MAQGFKATPRGITARFTDEEVRILTQLLEDVALTLEPEEDPAADPLAALVGISDNTAIPTDPAVARMLPVASDDPEVADDFRRYTELDLRHTKIANLRQAALDLRGGQPLLTLQGAQAWAAALNDVRLTLGARLNITSEEDAGRIGTHTDWEKVTTTEDYMALIYNFVSWLQETLMEALLNQLDT